MATPTSKISNSLDAVVTEISSATPKKLVSDLNISKEPSVTSENNYLLYFLLVVILLFLGFNLFGYLGKGADSLKNLFSPILRYFGYAVGETAKTTINESQEGTKFAADVVGDSIKDAIDVSEKTLNISNTPSLKNDINLNKKKSPKLPKEDRSDSLSQQNRGKSKAGFCYIGEDRGFRSCVKVGENDTCMSGEIFPSRQICINPTLRE